MIFRKLRADEIDCRVGQVGNGYFTILLYKDARCDMNILDESGVIWQRDHKEIKGNLYCGVGIFDERVGQFIWKWDCGTESNTEKEKGEASDSFKRACVNWGIGRELYTSPLIYVKTETAYANDKYFVKDKKETYGNKVKEITYNEKGEIATLVIVDSKGVEIFSKKPMFLNKPKTMY